MALASLGVQSASRRPDSPGSRAGRYALAVLTPLSALLGAGIFTADLLLPADVEVGYAYLLAIALAARGTSRRVLWISTGVALLLMVLGVLIDPVAPTGAAWVPLVNRSIAVVSALLLARFADQRLRAEQRQRLLTRELSHRVKNALSIAQAFALHSFGKLSMPAVEDFSMRLAAVAAANDLLTARDWQPAGLRETVQRGLLLVEEHEAQIALEGPDLPLPADAVVNVTLAVHELSTNALKYGALSVAVGRVAIRWRRAEAGGIQLRWQETGGPPVSAPQHQGFGSSLLDSVTANLGATARTDFLPAGLVWEIDLPPDRIR